MAGFPWRYAPDFPLPGYAFLPGGRRPDPLVRNHFAQPGDLFRFGVDLFNRAFYWEAHEHWETLWREATHPQTRSFLKGLIQQAAAGVHLRRGAQGSCRRLGRRSLRYMGPLASRYQYFFGLDLVSWLARWQRFLARPLANRKSLPCLILTNIHGGFPDPADFTSSAVRNRNLEIQKAYFEAFEC